METGRNPLRELQALFFWKHRGYQPGRSRHGHDRFGELEIRHLVLQRPLVRSQHAGIQCRRRADLSDCHAASRCELRLDSHGLHQRHSHRRPFNRDPGGSSGVLDYLLARLHGRLCLPHQQSRAHAGEVALCPPGWLVRFADRHRDKCHRRWRNPNEPDHRPRRLLDR